MTLLRVDNECALAQSDQFFVIILLERLKVKLASRNF